MTGNSFGQEIPVLDWTKTTQGGRNDFNRASVTATALDPSGNLYVTGSFDYTADFDPGPGVFNLTPVGNGDAFILKLDSDGNFIWAVQFGSTLADIGNDIAVDLSGNIYFTGEFPQTFDADPGAAIVTITPASRDIVIIKLNTNGNLLWVKKMGSAAFDVGYSLDVNSTGDVYVTGFHGGTVDFDPGPGTVNIGGSGGFLLKLTKDGDYVWVKLPPVSREVKVDNADNILLNGWFSASVSFSTSSGPVTLTSAGNTDFFISKYLANGTVTWAKSMGGTAADESYSITTDQANNVYTTGSFSSTADFDPSVGTFTLSSTTLSVFISKLDANGNFVLAKQITGTGNNSSYSIAVDAAQNIYTTGRFRLITDFDPGTGIKNLTAIGSNIDAFVSKLDNNGNYVWAAQMGGVGSGAEPTGYAININSVGSVYTTGIYRSTIDFDPSACLFNIIGDGGFDVFVQKLSLGTALPPASISSFSPGSGSVGATIILNGTNFSAIPANNVVKFFNGKTATVTASTATSISAIVPTGAITGPISVTVNCATGQTSTNFVVSVPSPPTISGFTPTSGPVGATVTITGTNFSTTSTNNTVKFNGTTAVVTASTATSITTTVPTGATTGKITVTVGGNTATSSTNFTVTAGAIPTITSFTPTSGNVGTTVIITGTNFSTTPSNNTVKFFDGVDSYVVNAVVTASTTTSITTTVPPGAFTGKIKVSTAGGTATSPSDFTVTCGPLPTITSFSPITGTPGTIVTITGTNFSSTPSNNIVDFGGTTATVTASTSTSITTSVPTGPVGLVPISITIACNSVSSSTDFDVTCPPAPTITSFTPGTGAVGTVVTITGTNFSTNPSDSFVDFNGEPAIVTASTATSITTSVPVNAFTGPIKVYVGCDYVSSATDFIVDCGPAPTITSFTPSNGLAGTVVTITGANFSTTPANNFVDFNGELAVVTASTATSITTTVPVGAITGPITIVVDCNYVTSTTDFTVGNMITITTQPSDFIACVGQTATFTTAATGTTNITYQWQYSPDGIVPFTDISNGGGYANATTATLSVNTTGNFGLGRYRCRINGDFASEVVTNDEGLFVNPIPTPPTATSANRCGAGSVTLSASGGTNGQYKWYTVASGGTPIAGEVNSTFSSPSISATTTYFVSLTVSSCESARTAVTATINLLPTAPTATGASACLPSASISLGASGGTNGQYRWYTVATGGTAIAGQTGPSFTTPTITTTTTYFVSIDNGTCESVRTPVVATLLSCTTPPSITTAPLSTSIGGVAELDLVPLISTVNNPLNISSIVVTVQPASGALASISNGRLLVNYANVSFSGKESVTVRACDNNGNCATQQFEIEVAGDVIVFNAISPNGANPTFVLQYIDIIPETKNNIVTIFDRWQNEVWKGENYNNSSVVFKGASNGGNDLPTGTYFYKIEFASGKKMRIGFISLKR